MIKNNLFDVLLCKSSVLSLHPQAERFVVNPVRGVVDLNKISISTFVDSRKTPRGFARGFLPSLFVILNCRAVQTLLALSVRKDSQKCQGRTE